MKMRQTFTRHLITGRRKLLVGCITIAFLVSLILVNVLKDSPANPIKEQYESLPNPTAKKLFLAQSDGLTKPVDQRLVALDMLTIGCFGSQHVLEMDDSDPSLGGQCCGVLKSVHMYEEQLEALEAYKDLPEIPNDPYNIPVALAKKLNSYDRDIVLTSEQQKVLDDASAMSNEGGPCCCKCWKWYAYSGLAKYLITNYHYNAEQIAKVWDISDSCGEHGDHHSGVVKQGVHAHLE